MEVSNTNKGPFAGWVEGYEGGDIVLRVVHGEDDVPRERIPVAECGKLVIDQAVQVIEEQRPDGSVHPHLLRGVK